MLAPTSCRVGLAAIAVVFAACSESVTAPEAPQQVPGVVSAQADQDVVTSAAATIAGTITSLSADEAAAGIAVAGLSLVPGDALRESGGDGTSTGDKPAEGTETGTTTFGDKTETKSVSRSFQFFDAAGNRMTAFVRGTTASVRFLLTTDVRRTMDSTYVAASHSRSDHTLSGLLGDRRVWNGTGSSADTTTHREGTSLRTYTGTAADTIAAVTFMANRDLNRYPLSGTAIRVVNYVKTFTGRETGTMTVNRRVVVTFNGTNMAVMRIGTVTCSLNLDTRKAESCS